MCWQFRQFRSYFHAHDITVLTNQSLKHLLQKYDTVFITESTRFIAQEAPPPASEEESDEKIQETWELYTDGSSSVEDSRGKISVNSA